jgi:hypothetical protein
VVGVGAELKQMGSADRAPDDGRFVNNTPARKEPAGSQKQARLPARAACRRVAGAAPPAAELPVASHTGQDPRPGHARRRRRGLSKKKVFEGGGKNLSLCRVSAENAR